jgi:hypothetical protein
MDKVWDFIKSEDPIVKARYVLRNYGAFGSAEEILEYLEKRPELLVICHREYPDWPKAGCYSIWLANSGATKQSAGNGPHITLRVDPSTPSVNGPKHGVYSFVVW